MQLLFKQNLTLILLNKSYEYNVKNCILIFNQNETYIENIQYLNNILFIIKIVFERKFSCNNTQQKFLQSIQITF